MKGIAIKSARVFLAILALPVAALAQWQGHSADTSQNNRIGLFELTRVIELYNTRYGTMRSGCYVVNPLGEDGFAPDAARDPADAVTLSSYHSGDSNRDGKIGLLELTRVIAL